MKGHEEVHIREEPEAGKTPEISGVADKALVMDESKAEPVNAIP